MHRRIRRYKITFVSTSGKKFSFKTLALHSKSVLDRVVNHLNKKLEKEVKLDGDDLLIDGHKVAVLESVERIAKKKE